MTNVCIVKEPSANQRSIIDKLLFHLTASGGNVVKVCGVFELGVRKSNVYSKSSLTFNNSYSGEESKKMLSKFICPAP